MRRHSIILFVWHLLLLLHVVYLCALGLDPSVANGGAGDYGLAETAVRRNITDYTSSDGDGRITEIITDMEVEVDPNGYVFACMCMGRIGNQIAHFIGTLGAAKVANRTLVVPPLITRFTPRGPEFVEFADYFDVEYLQANFHRVINAETFMHAVAPTAWPRGQRRGYCLRPNQDDSSCNMKNGSPFGPFWDRFGVEFDKDLPDYTFPYPFMSAKAWVQFSPDAHPVIALRGAPASFPVETENRYISKYLRWSSSLRAERDAFVARYLPRPYVAAHLRHGSDWISACKTMAGYERAMSSWQCGTSPFTEVQCLQDVNQAVNDIAAAVASVGALSVLLTTDDPHFARKVALRLALDDSFRGVVIVHEPPRHIFLDLALLEGADLLLGNCVSSFTAVASRRRTAEGRPSRFFGCAAS